VFRVHIIPPVITVNVTSFVIAGSILCKMLVLGINEMIFAVPLNRFLTRVRA
jgi:hypothetical protein